MKTRLSTPSHDSAADKTAKTTPQPRSTTPSLDSAVGRKQARPPPANPYRTPTRYTSENARCHALTCEHTLTPYSSPLTGPNHENVNYHPSLQHLLHTARRLNSRLRRTHQPHFRPNAFCEYRRSLGHSSTMQKL